MNFIDSTSPPGNAERRLGSSPHRGWYSRGYLPHLDAPDLLQFITYRLKDSLPAEALELTEAELRNIPPERRNAERRKRLEARLDAGLGSCVLRNPKAADCVVANWKRFDGERYDLIAWVVMPNHVHTLIRVYEGTALGKIVQSWKSYTGRKICEIEDCRAGARRSREDGKFISKENGLYPSLEQQEVLSGKCGESIPRERRAPARQQLPGRAVWMPEYWDRFIRNEKHFNSTVNYIHENPVKAGLVANAEDWPWSSARRYLENEDGG